jgi:hypothetical protein
MPRGGKRPGAGAPKGNMNALKHGAYSRQFAQVGALLAQDPTMRRTLLDLARKHGLKQQRANEVAALLFTRLFERAESIAAGAPVHPEPVEGPRRSAKPAEPAEANRLNLTFDTDDRDTIKQAGAAAAARQLRKLARDLAKMEIAVGLNQTLDTEPEN